MHKPTDEEKKTYARYIAAEMTRRLKKPITMRHVRKLRQKGMLRPLSEYGK